jgi:3-hydroxyisobutyrate dehydrogenase-like beta-hydroxyacid dehydrogenase
MRESTPRIGFVGLGRMGGAMAHRLLAAGYPLSGTARTREHLDPLLAEGLRRRDTPRAVAEVAEIVFTSLPDDEAVNAVASGEDGILAGLASDAVWVEMSTVSPRASREVAVRVRERGARMLDAPVSGSVPQAQTGTLTIMVGGDKDAYARLEPILRDLGTPTHVGGNGQGLVLKLAINISLGVQMLAFAEGLVLAERSGIDRDLALAIMIQSAIGSPMLKARASNIFDLPDEAWFDLDFMHKDIDLALAAAGELHIPLPTAARTEEILTAAHALGYGGSDLAALFEVLEQMTDERAEAA